MHLHRMPNGKWRVQVRRKVDGEFVHKSKTFEFKSEAEAWGLDQERMLDSATLRMDSAFELYFDEVMKPKEATLETPNARSTYNKRMANMRSIQKSVGTAPVEGFGAVELKDYVDRRLSKVSSGTVRKEVYIISGIFEFLIKDKLMTTLVNPARQIRMPEDAPGRTSIHTPEDRTALTNALSGEAQAVYELLLETACRVSEVVYLRAEWLDWENMEIDLPATATKSREGRSVPMSSKASDILSKWAKGKTAGRLFSQHPDSIRNTYNRVRKQLGLEHLRLHDCRHTKITDMVSKATNLFEVREVSGHASLQMLERYTHLKKKKLHHLMD
ncbi:tyrosine-type recombinase/integrase [Marinobacter similis]|uniref:Tyr recombinase domain-containing protein n=1 Tax=Marinobacter similis TaxID=1420916 RepID=W5YMC3_9GAMM|nr:site-specific integrase [Marinobacter similis]AHI30251.1 hypothetical protein AU14_17365 [Marinobacter similis]